MTRRGRDKPKAPSDGKALRQRAEAAMRSAQTEDISRLSADEVSHLVHELRIHQIELELQNEELTRAQTELAAAHDELSDLYDFAPVGYLTLDANGTVLQANLTAATWLGVERGALIKQRFTHFVAPESQDTLFLHQRAVQAEARQQTCQLTLARADRSTFPVELTSALVEGPTANGAWWRWVLADISTRQRAELALGESERRFVTLANLAPVGISRADAVGRVTYVNDRMSELTGLTRDQARDMGWTQCIHADDRERVLRDFQRAIETDHVGQSEFRCVRADGRVAWMFGQSAPEKDAAGRTTGMIGTLTDITSAKLADEALLERHEQRLLETSAEGVLSVDHEGVIMTANPAAHRLFDWAPGTLVGQAIDTLLPEAARTEHARHRAAYVAAPRPRPMGLGLQLVALRRDGSTFPVEISLNHVATTAGARTVAFVTDISERARAAASLRAYTTELEQRAAQLRRLASDLTLTEQSTREQLAKTLHDHLQQLLFSASLKLDRVLSRAEGDATLVGRARAEVQDAIAASRSLAVELFPPALRSGLPAALEWLAGWVREKYDVTLDVAIDRRANPDGEDVRILLFESVRELVFNAIKHAGVPRLAITLALGPDDAVRIAVADEGKGFDPRVALDSGSLRGMGLFSIRERLTLLGGRLEVDSAPGKGARFTMTVPRRAVAHTASPVEAATPLTEAAGVPFSLTAAMPTLRILLVDDHAIVREGLRELLAERPELEVVGEAPDGAEAVRQAHALGPDVVVMDVSMPVLDGVEATRRIRSELPNIRVFGLSTYEQADRLHAIEEAGASGYFTKDEGAQRLVARLLVEHAVRSGPGAATG